MIPALEGGQGLHCLVVDDSRVVRKAARRLLEGFGFTVREAEDGQQALDACRDTLPDLVLLDWNMPVMDGLEFLRAVRAEYGPDRPLVMLCTTENTPDKIVEALDAGAQEYVMKPFDAEILGGKLEQLGLLPEAL
jgi:two-component system chemotaxis response regulator CheY